LLTMQAFLAAGAQVIVADIRQESLAMAQRLGADAAIDSSRPDAEAKLLELTNGVGADIVVETAGAARTPRMAINWTRPGGTTVLVGICTETLPFDFNEIVGLERTVIGSVGASPGDMEIATEMIARGDISVSELVSTVIPLERVIEDGFERMARAEEGIFRIVVAPNS